MVLLLLLSDITDRSPITGYDALLSVSLRSDTVLRGGYYWLEGSNRCRNC